MDIKFTVPDEKVSKITAAFKGLWAIPTNEDGSPKFTDGEWAKQCIKNFIVATVQRYEQMVAQKAAAESVQADTDIVT